MLTLDLCQVDDESRLFISPAIQEWALPGKEAVSRLRDRRPGALFNATFAAYLESL